MGFLDNLQILFGKKPATTQTTDPATGAPATQATTQKKIIIIEDETVLADALEIKFKHENFQVFKAENGQIGLDMIKANKPDIVLLDLMMPVMDGKTMLRKMREIQEFKYTPVVVLTNAGDVQNMKETKQYDNASAFLIKSNISPDDVVNLVHELVR